MSTAIVVASMQLLAAQRLHAGSMPDDFCTGDPCIISGDQALDGPAVLDFGGRSVIVSGNLDVGDNSLVINAGSFAITGTGQVQGSAGDVEITAQNDIAINGTRANGAVRLVGDDGGDLTLNTAQGSVSGSGRIVLSSSNSLGDGGTLTIDSAADVSLTGLIEMVGGNQAGGGSLDGLAEGDFTLTGGLDLSGGEDGGGLPSIEAGGSVTLGDLTFNGSGDLGDAGDGDFSAGGGVRLAGAVRARGSGASADGCGEGGGLDVSGATITIEGEIDLRALAGDCCGGSMSLDGGTLEVRADVSISGDGSEGGGGLLSLEAEEDFSCNTHIDLSGNDFGGDGFVNVLGDVTTGSKCEIDADGRVGSITFLAGGDVQVHGALHAGAPGGSAAFGASIDLTGCNVLVGATGSLQAIGNGSENSLTAAGNIDVAGTIAAGGQNVFRFPVGFSAGISGSVDPPPTLNEDPELTPCGDRPTPTNTPRVTPTSTPTSTVTPNATFTATPSVISTPTVTGTVEATPTPTPEPVECTGDCNGDSQVDVSELVTAVRILLGVEDLSSCPAIDANGNGIVRLDEVVAAVANSLAGCPPGEMG